MVSQYSKSLRKSQNLQHIDSMHDKKNHFFLSKISPCRSSFTSVDETKFTKVLLGRHHYFLNKLILKCYKLCVEKYVQKVVLMKTKFDAKKKKEKKIH